MVVTVAGCYQDVTHGPLCLVETKTRRGTWLHFRNPNPSLDDVCILLHQNHYISSVGSRNQVMQLLANRIHHQESANTVSQALKVGILPGAACSGISVNQPLFAGI